MNKAFFNLCVVFSLFSTGFTFAQSPSISAYKNDLVILKTSFENNHPSLYRFKSKASIDKLFNNCARQINQRTSDRDFYKIIKFILSNIHDGHLSCDPSTVLQKQLDEKEAYFPMPLYFTGRKAYIDYTNVNHFPLGTEILQINDEDINSIRKKLFNYLVSDGKIKTKKYWILRRYFWIYYNIAYGQADEYKVKYKDQTGRIATIVLKGVLRKDIEQAEQPSTKLLAVNYLKNSTALLTIKSFAEDNLVSANLNFTNFIDSTFKNLRAKNTRSLIIDVRGNGGGQDINGSLLYSYLTDSTFRYYAKLQTVTKELTAINHPNLSIQKSNPNNFKGKVYILINGLSFSATSEFCTVAKDSNRATFVGEETGGTYCGNTSGNFHNVVLPFSKITISIPTTKYTMFVTDRKNKDRGIIPEFSIKPTITDLLEKKDVQLNFAIQLAERETAFRIGR